MCLFGVVNVFVCMCNFTDLKIDCTYDAESRRQQDTTHCCILAPGANTFNLQSLENQSEIKELS